MQAIIAESRGKLQIVTDGDSHIAALKIVDVAYPLEHYALFREFFRELLLQVNSRFANKLIEDRLVHLLGYGLNDFSVSDTVVETYKGVVIHCILIHSVSGVSERVRCSIRLEKSSKPYFKVTNELGSPSHFDRVTEYLKTYSGQLETTFRGFTPLGKFSTILLSLSPYSNNSV